MPWKQIRKPLIVSVAFALALFGLTFLLYFSISYMGERDATIERIVLTEYRSSIVWFNLKILGIYLTLALTLGLFAAWLRLTRTGEILLWNGGVWLTAWLHAIKVYPGLFVDQLYAKGGLHRLFQLGITDYLPLVLIDGLFLVAVGWLGWARRRRLAAGTFILLCVLWSVPWPVRAVRPDWCDPQKPNVLILATDSLRPDRLGINGYSRPTPHIDRLLAEGGNFLNARSSLARTFSSFTSILTSRFPPDHGIRHMFPRPEEIESHWQTLPEVFNQAGYATSLTSDFSGDIFARQGYGFSRIQAPHLTLPNLIKQRSLEFHYFLLAFLIHPPGRTLFPVMNLMPLGIEPRYVTRGSQQAIDRALAEGRPFFHLYFSSNNHFPYGSREPYYRMFADRAYRGPYKYRKVDMMKRASGYDVPEADRNQVNALYDGATRLFDDQVGEMLSFLERCGVRQNTIIVLMSDHGESLYEDGYGSGHGDHLRGPHSNAMVFGVWSPREGFAGRQITPTVRDIDIAPTVLELAGLPVPAQFRGVSLLPALRGASFAGLPVYLETEIWYTPETPYIADRIRIPYPDIKKLLELNPQSGELYLKADYLDVVLRAKYRGMQLNGLKYTFLPGEKWIQEEFTFDDRPVPKDSPLIPELLKLKGMIPQMFPGRISIDDSGRLTEPYRAPGK